MPLESPRQYRKPSMGLSSHAFRLPVAWPTICTDSAFRPSGCSAFAATHCRHPRQQAANSATPGVLTRWLVSKASTGRFESLLMISPSEPNCLRRLTLTRRGFDVLGRRGEPVPNDTQGGD